MTKIKGLKSAVGYPEIRSAPSAFRLGQFPVLTLSFRALMDVIPLLKPEQFSNVRAASVVSGSANVLPDSKFGWIIDRISC
jgi:hypothetical protein